MRTVNLKIKNTQQQVTFKELDIMSKAFNDINPKTRKTSYDEMNEKYGLNLCEMKTCFYETVKEKKNVSTEAVNRLLKNRRQRQIDKLTELYVNGNEDLNKLVSQWESEALKPAPQSTSGVYGLSNSTITTIASAAVMVIPAVVTGLVTLTFAMVGVARCFSK